ncbi:hypothetical protein CNMCM7691_002869 [Aspergillus felis]|uniref:Major facilitator superfamily (MFS) profile domain-containing protein n=1 Tax=Aspergillus felis TaxID=1287682 RepID=A0A8H6R290_9EURO|nr:hypothetical protein CNMCM7691_002869 [Aspergillus felis]
MAADNKPASVASKDSNISPTEREVSEKATSTGSDAEAQRGGDSVPEDPKTPPREISGWKWFLVVLAIYSSQFLFALDNTIVANVQPVIVSNFNSVEKLPWVSVAFLIGAAGTNLIWGKVFGQFNGKWTYILSVFVFEVGSAVCGAAPNMNALIIGRAICGVSGSGMYVGLMTLLAATTTIHERPMYVGGGGFIWGVGTVLGPIIGGAFTDSSAGWRWAFYINLCVGAVCAPVYLFLLPNKDPRPGVSLRERANTMDHLGGILTIGAMVTGVMAVSFGGVMYPWDSGRIIGLFCCSGVLFILLGLQQVFTIFTSVTHRVLPVEFFKGRTVLILFATTPAGGGQDPFLGMILSSFLDPTWNAPPNGDYVATAPQSLINEEAHQQPPAFFRNVDSTQNSLSPGSSGDLSWFAPDRMGVHDGKAAIVPQDEMGFATSGQPLSIVNEWAWDSSSNGPLIEPVRHGGADDALFMHYLDRVFHIQYPFYLSRNPRGRGCLFSILRMVKPAYLATLALSERDLLSTHPQQGNVTASLTQLRSKGGYYDLAAQGTQRLLQESHTWNRSAHMVHNIESLASILQLLFWELFAGGRGNWQVLLREAARLIPGLLEARTPLTKPKPAFMALIFEISLPDRWKEESQAVRKLSIIDLAERGRQIEQRLRQELVDMDSLPETGPSLLNRSGALSAPANPDVNRLFALSALSYLHVAISGAHPELPDIADAV